MVGVERGRRKEIIVRSRGRDWVGEEIYKWRDGEKGSEGVRWDARG